MTANGASTLKLGHARAAAMVAAAYAGLPVVEYAAKVVKKAVVGTGSADKAQVRIHDRAPVASRRTRRSPTPLMLGPWRSLTRILEVTLPARDRRGRASAKPHDRTTARLGRRSG